MREAGLSSSKARTVAVPLDYFDAAEAVLDAAKAFLSLDMNSNGRARVALVQAIEALPESDQKGGVTR